MSANAATAQGGKGKARERHVSPQLDYTGESEDIPPRQKCSLFSDRDEREGEEHVHACFSPPKHGRREDSQVSNIIVIVLFFTFGEVQDLLTVNTGDDAPFQHHHHVRSQVDKPLRQLEDYNSSEEVSSKPTRKRIRPVTSNLPLELLQPANRWKHDIMPALFLWVAARKDVWNIPVKELVDALTTICRACVRRDYSIQRDGNITGEGSPEYRLVSHMYIIILLSLSFPRLPNVSVIGEAASGSAPCG